MFLQAIEYRVYLIFRGLVKALFHFTVCDIMKY